MHVVFVVVMFVLGSAVGSFLCCQARRMHYGATKKQKKLGPRSVCMNCKYQLRWYDNIPIVSWLWLCGKCRKCKAKIGLAELLSEIGMGLAFAAIGCNIDISISDGLAWASFAANLLLVSTLGFLAIYDGLYGELPTLCLTIAIICAIIVVALREWAVVLVVPFSVDNILRLVGSVAVLGGTYLILYAVSRGKWVGDGDWLLGVAIGLALGSPWLALIVLFAANFLACIVMLPAAHKNKKIKVHLGPFLVVGYVIVFALADFLMAIIN